MTHFSKLEKIAELGALSRFSIIFSFMAAPLVQVYGPRFSREGKSKNLKNLFFKLFIGYFLVNLGIICFAYFFAEYFLLLLGANYGNLREEFIFFIIFQSIYSLTGVSNTLKGAKAWTDYLNWNIPCSLFLQLFFCFFLDLTNLKSYIFWFALPVMSEMALGLLAIQKNLTGLEQSENAPKVQRIE